MSSSTMPLAHGAPAFSEAQLVLLRDLLEAHRSFRGTSSTSCAGPPYSHGAPRLTGRSMNRRHRASAA